MQRGTYFGIILLVALAIIAVVATGAEDSTVLWNKTYGGPDADDAAYAMVPIPGGAGFFLAGETASFGEGKADAWVVRLAPDGTEEWNKTYGGKESDVARSLILTDDGNLLFAGNLTLVTNGTRADTDAWIVKTDPAGGEIWNRTYGGPDVNASANAVTGTDDGGYVFAGTTASWGENESAAWVVRLNGTGEEVWSRTFGETGNNRANAVTRLPGGGFVVAGSTESAGAGTADIWVVRLDESGDEVWNRTFGSPDDDTGREVITTSDGNLLVAGTFTERPDNTTVDTDVLLLKLTPDGEVVWNWIYGDFGVNESANAVIETADGGYLVAGETGFSGVNDTDAWLVATDAEGAVAWSKTFGGENPGAAAASVIEIAPGNYLFAGTFNATQREGPVNLDAWTVRLGPEPTPTPTLTPTATPTPGPTVTPIKPPKAPVVPQKAPVTKPGDDRDDRDDDDDGHVIPTPTRAGTPMPTGTMTPRPTHNGDDDNGDDFGDDDGDDVGDDNGDDNGDDHGDDFGDDVDDDNGDDNQNTSALSGRVWYDLNADGVPDTGEPGIPGIGVRLIGMKSMADHAVTGPDGSYQFETIPSGGYSGVEFLMPDGYSCTVSGNGSDANPQDESVAFAEGGAGQQTLNAGFIGNYRPVAPAEAYGWILGTTWNDGDGDGLKNEGHGLTGVEVRLLNASGDQVASARTGHHDDYFSTYLFGPLPPGEYSLAFILPDDYVFTSTGGDSHADPVTGATTRFQVGGGETAVRDAGLISASPTQIPIGATPPSPATGEEEGADDDGMGGTGDGADDERENDDDEAGDDDRERPAVTAAPQNPGDATSMSTDDTDDGAGGEQDDARTMTAGDVNEDDDDDEDKTKDDKDDKKDKDKEDKKDKDDDDRDE
ncbi:SdrD B-like domain-containing protein [Methanoculleus sp.]|uniref:SdrD B-like domain-containing protein n=1 Tax=Methanoculleus sp. TaxID=90427 RepID=UPI002FC80B24